MARHSELAAVTPANTTAPAMMPATALSKVGTMTDSGPTNGALLRAALSTQ